MIYNLTHEFTMLEQTEGLMQNMTLNTPVELVTCDSNPQKDSGVALMPLEKMNFATCGNERIFARCTKLDGTIATLSVINLHDSVKSACNSRLQKMMLIPKIEKFEVAGTYEWTVPQNGWYKVYATGGGGAGGNAYFTPGTTNVNARLLAGSAGGGGGTAIKNLFLTENTVIPIVVGAGSVPVTGNKNAGLYYGTQGGTSSFGQYISATGGFSGESRSVDYSWGCSNSHGGKGIGGDYNHCGFSGDGHSAGGGPINIDLAYSFHFYSSAGGASYWGATGLDRQYGELEGKDGTAWGTGGSGGRAFREVDVMHYGGKGADGVVIIEWTEVQ